MLLEIDTKAGLDNALYSDQGRLQDQRNLGTLILKDGHKIDKDLNDQNMMSIQEFIPKSGYAPVRLISRGINVIQQSMAKKTGTSRLLLKKRPRYVLDTKLEAMTDEYFRDVIRPRQLLIDSEEIAIRQLKESAGISTQTLHQTPMIDRQQDIAFNMLSAQMTSSMYRGSAQGFIQGGLPVNEEEQKAAQPNQVPVNQYPNYQPYTVPPITGNSSLPVDYGGDRANYDQYFAELRLREWYQANKLTGNTKHMEWIHGQRYDPVQDEKMLGLNVQYEAVEPLPPIKGKPNIYGFKPDDEVDLDNVEGLTAKEFKRLQRWAEKHLGWIKGKGMKIKRSVLDAYLTGTESFQELVRTNKVKLAAIGGGVAALALAYNMKDNIPPGMVEQANRIGQEGLGLMQGMGLNIQENVRQQFATINDKIVMAKGSIIDYFDPDKNLSAEDVQEMLDLTGLGNSRFFGEDERTFFQQMGDWAMPGLLGANVGQLGRAMWRDPITHDMLLKAKQMFNKGMTYEEGVLFQTIIKKAADMANGNTGVLTDLYQTILSGGSKMSEWWHSTYLGEMLSPITKTIGYASDLAGATSDVLNGKKGFWRAVWAGGKLMNQLYNPASWTRAMGTTGLGGWLATLYMSWPAIFVTVMTGSAISNRLLTKKDTVTGGVVMDKVYGIDGSTGAVMIDRAQSVIKEGIDVSPKKVFMDVVLQTKKYEKPIDSFLKGDIKTALGLMQQAISDHYDWYVKYAKDEAVDMFRGAAAKAKGQIITLWNSLGNKVKTVDGKQMTVEEYIHDPTRKIASLTGGEDTMNALKLFMMLKQKPELLLPGNFMRTNLTEIEEHSTIENVLNILQRDRMKVLTGQNATFDDIQSEIDVVMGEPVYEDAIDQVPQVIAEDVPNTVPQVIEEVTARVPETVPQVVTPEATQGIPSAYTMEPGQDKEESKEQPKIDYAQYPVLDNVIDEQTAFSKAVAEGSSNPDYYLGLKRDNLKQFEGSLIVSIPRYVVSGYNSLKNKSFNNLLKQIIYYTIEDDIIERLKQMGVFKEQIGYYNRLMDIAGNEFEKLDIQPGREEINVARSKDAIDDVIKMYTKGLRKNTDYFKNRIQGVFINYK